MKTQEEIFNPFYIVTEKAYYQEDVSFAMDTLKRNKIACALVKNTKSYKKYTVIRAVEDTANFPFSESLIPFNELNGIIVSAYWAE